MMKSHFVDTLILFEKVVHRHNRLKTTGIFASDKAVCGHQ